MKKNTKSLKEIYNEALLCEMPYRMSEQETLKYIKDLEKDLENDEKKSHIGRKNY
jgi:hypothetical protein